MLRKFGIIAVLSLMAVALAAVPVLAATNFANAPSGAHYKNRFAEPVCSSTTDPDTGAITVSCTGTQIGGVGNTNATLSLVVSGTANFVCHNPGNENIVEPHSGTATDTTTVPLAPSRNGTLIVPPVEGSISPEEAAAQFSCPNANWTEEFTGFTDTSFTYSLTFAGFTAPVISIPG
jgi:hypothetical protein